MKQKFEFEFDIYNSISELEQPDQELLKKAYQATKLAYSPYSNFKVGVAGITNKGHTLIGSNQENSSYSVTICAERVLLSTLSTQYPDEHITTLAISSIDTHGKDNLVTPCGVCRQALSEHQIVHKHNMRIILGTTTGQIYVIKKASDLLPLAFSLI